MVGGFLLLPQVWSERKSPDAFHYHVGVGEGMKQVPGLEYVLA